MIFTSFDHRLAHPGSLIQKCDAKRPCTTCTAARTAAECVYDDQRILYPTGLGLSYDAEDYPAGQQLRDAGSVELSIHALASCRFAGTPSSPSSPAELTQAYCHSSGTIDGIYPEEHIESIPSTPAFPSFFNTYIPPDLRANLSFLCEENLQVTTSETDATDTDMKSCVFG